jgi:hypothetical protein
MTQITPNDDLKFDNREKIISLFFIFFAIVVIFSQVLQFINAKKIDESYSRIITSKNKAIHATHSILIQSSTIQRALSNLSTTSDPGEVSNLKERLSDAIKKNEGNLITLQNSLSDNNKDEQELLQKINEASDTYKKRYQSYLQVLDDKNKSKDELYDLRVKSLRPALEGYQGLQQELLTMFTDDFSKQSQLLSETNNRTGLTLLALGMSPYIFILIALIYFILKLLGVSFFSKEKLSV